MQENQRSPLNIQRNIENQLSQPGVSYETQVSVVLLGWQHLAGAVECDMSEVQPLASFLYRWSLRLILQVEWLAITQTVKTSMGATLQQCSRDAILQPLCCTLLPLVKDPWGQTKSIFSNPELQDDEAINYISSETWEVMRVRVDTMIECRLEDLAFQVLKVCIRCIRLGSEGMEVPLCTNEDHNHFVDLYFVLLHKFKRNAFIKEVKELDVIKGVNLVRRLVKKQDKGKIGKQHLKTADLTIQVLLAEAIIKEYTNDFIFVFLEWCSMQIAVEVSNDLLSQMIHKYMQLFPSSQHLYGMSSILYKKFGNQLTPLVTQLLIGALTKDMNSLAALRLEQVPSKEEQTQIERQMADGFMDLSAVFQEHKKVARECVLTAFSLHPTTERLILLHKYSSKPVEVLQEWNRSVSSTAEAHQSVSPTVENCHLVSPSLDDRPTLKFHQSASLAVDSHLCESPSFSAQQEFHKSNSPAVESHEWTSPTPDPSCVSSVLPTYLSSPSSFSPAVWPVPSSLPSLSLTFPSTPLHQNPLSSPSHPSSPPPSLLLYQPSSLPHIPSSLSLQVCPASTSICNSSSSLLNSPSNFSEENTLQGSSSITVDLNSTSSTMNYFHGFLDNQETNLSKEQGSKLDMSCGRLSLNTTGVEEPRNTEDDNSMDKFYKITEEFVEQLSQEPPKTVPMSKHANALLQKHADLSYGIPTQPRQVSISEELGLSEELFDDLVVVLSSPRWKVLSWKRDWCELSSICEHYLRDSDSIKSMNKELNYLNIDYSQFQNMARAEISEFTGIEKGYEHFIEQESESGISKDSDFCKKGEDSHKKVSLLSHAYDSDSDCDMNREMKDSPCSMITISSPEDSASDFDTSGETKDSLCPMITISSSEDSNSNRNVSGEMKDNLCPMITLSSSEESDMETKGKMKLVRMDSERDVVEDTRVMALSNQDWRKSIRIDVETGKVKHNRNLLNTLRLFRHQKYEVEQTTELKYKAIHEEILRLASHTNPLSMINLSPHVVLTTKHKSAVDQVQRATTTVTAGPHIGTKFTFPSSQPRASWRYMGSLLERSDFSTSSSAATSVVALPHSTFIQCYLQLKDSKVGAAPLLVNNQSSNLDRNSDYHEISNKSTSGFDGSYAKFLLQQSFGLNGKEPFVTITRKSMKLSASLN